VDELDGVGVDEDLTARELAGKGCGGVEYLTNKGAEAAAARRKN
jgi:hypothetical protein